MAQKQLIAGHLGFCAILICLAVGISACTRVPQTRDANDSTSNQSTTSETSAATGPDIQLIPLQDGIWLHRSAADIAPWGRVEANGLLVVGSTDALMIDTPWNDAQTRWLIMETQKRFHVPISKVIVTHAHDDNLGGLSEAHQQHIVSYASSQTVEIADSSEKPVPQNGFTTELELAAADRKITLFYPGAGHTADNIVVYLQNEKILYGGCLIKALAAASIGNTADARVDDWSHSVDTLTGRFPETSVVVPGHGDAGDIRLLEHTKEIVRTYLSQVQSKD